MGFLVNGKLEKQFSLRPYKARIDRHLNIYREANEGKSLAYLAGKFLSLIVESAGGVSYPLLENGDSTPETEFRIHDWHFADAIYVYIYARIVNISELIEVPYRCHRCKTAGILKADLWTTDVKVMDSADEMHVWVDLQDGVKITDTGKVSKKIKLQPVKYRALFAAGASQADINSLSYAQLREAIVEVDGAPAGYVLRDEEIDEITKRDMLRIDRQAGAVSAGPDMRTTVECPKEACGVKIRDALNWAFDPFFDTSVPYVALQR